MSLTSFRFLIAALIKMFWPKSMPRQIYFTHTVEHSHTHSSTLTDTDKLFSMQVAFSS